MAVWCMHNEKMQYYRYYRNNSVIVDFAMGQISRSTEHVSSNVVEFSFRIDGSENLLTFLLYSLVACTCL